MVQTIDHRTFGFDIAAEAASTAAHRKPSLLQRWWNAIERSRMAKAEREIARVLRGRNRDDLPPWLAHLR